MSVGDRVKVAWCALDEFDTDTATIMRCLIMAIQRRYPDFGLKLSERLSKAADFCRAEAHPSMLGWASARLAIAIFYVFLYKKRVLISRGYYNFDRINLLTETPSSADLMTISRCFSAGILNVKWPRKGFIPNGSGTGAPSSSSHLIVSFTTNSISLKAMTGVSP